MGMFKRIIKFGAGGIVGSVIGAVGAALTTPQNGRDLQAKVADRIRRAKIAGADAQIMKERELIERFRVSVDDSDALQETQKQARLATAETISAVGLGLNAPGALAAQETSLRAEETNPIGQ